MGEIHNKKLFNEFPPVSTEQWESVINADLHGADYEKRLIWQTLEGIKVRPYYRSEDIISKEYLQSLPGESPFTRGNRTNSNDWEIRQDIKLDNISTANSKSLFILDRGINSLGYRSNPDKGMSVLKSQEDFSNLMKNIYFECISLNFICGHNAPEIVNMIYNETLKKGINPKQVIGSVDYDPLGYLTINGHFGVDEETDCNILRDLINFAETCMPSYRVLGVNGYFFNNAGATIVQELSYSLAIANDYLSRITDKGLPVDTITKHMQFNFGVGSNYFMEIAKIRAARLLWARIVEEYHPESEKSKRAFIHSYTSEWNQTIYDPYVNLLRATTESMAAVLGGTDTLTVRPFDFAYKLTSKFSGRLARNIQIILKEESYLNKVADPGAGSYYIENLTDSIIEESWKIFLKIEDEGGYVEALKKGIIQADIEATAQNRNNLIATRRVTILGTNQYPNFNESVLENLEEKIVFKEAPKADSSIKPIGKYRGSMNFEKLRLATEKHNGDRPKVFMLSIGNLAMRKARATFSCNFFACAGYEVIDNIGFNTVEEGVEAARKANANIIVLCSSDEEYSEFAPLAYNLLNNKAILVVAGAPVCMEDLKVKGIKYFIHMKSNVLETLIGFHAALGIKI